MSKLLDQIGEKLRDVANTKQLSVVDLDIEKPTINGNRLLDTLLLYLMKPMNSMFLVGEDVDFIQSYVYSLSLLINDNQQLSNTIRISAERLKTSYPSLQGREKFIKAHIHALHDREFYLLDADRLISSVGNNKSEWDQFLSQLMNEVNQHNYYLVIPHIGKLFARDTEERIAYIGRFFFFATRGKARLTFFAPMSWHEYIEQIEYGRFGLLPKHVNSILFSPRPTEHKSAKIPELSPDSEFKF